jgi:hypothetical protein
MTETGTRRDPPGTLRPAFYAAHPGGWRDWWTVLHPPYTAWHLGYVVIGACLAPQVHTDRLVATVVAFFLAVGVAAHALDEVHGRPLETGIPTRWLLAAAALALGGAVGLGVLGVGRVGPALVPFVVVGPLLVVGYNLDVAPLHKDLLFAASWGAFPVLTGCVAQTGRLSWAAGAAGAGALTLSMAQRSLSTPARLLRRRSLGVTGRIEMVEGPDRALDRATLLEPLERALHLLAASVVLLAAALALARLT